MKFIKSILLILVSIIFFSIFGLEVNASSSFSGLETKITFESNETKIKKMQLALRDFGLYEGEIDGKYNSVKNSLLSYQRKTGLIKNDNDYGAGYFGVQTLKSLKEDYPKIFDKITQKYLKMDKPSTNTRYFFLTAYYSPLPGQKRYTTGSYAGDVRLNGGGKKTASGKKVFEGILAAPRNYEFGTKIEFEGLGVGVVEDRGGAIVNKGERGHEYDRIDVWMGYGDEGLERALKWGKRKVLGKVVPNTRPLTMQFDKSVVSQYKNLRVDAENPIKENVEKLQRLLTDVNLYNGKIDGKYENVRNVLIKFQLDKGIISSKNDDHAGYFGNKTYVALRKQFGGDIFKNRHNKLDEDVVLSKDIRDKLDKIHIKITEVINKKYGKNTLRSIAYRENLRRVIEYQTKKIKNDLRKRQLKYLKSII